MSLFDYIIVMNKMSTEKRAMILRLLVEGMSMRSITRTVGCSINTVTKLLEAAGTCLGEFQDEFIRNLPCTRLEVDEAWSFVYAKQEERGARQVPRPRKPATYGPGLRYAPTPRSSRHGA